MLHIDINDLIDHLHNPNPEIDFHLSVCRECREEFEFVCIVRDVLQEMVQVPEDLLEKTLEITFGPDHIPLEGDQWFRSWYGWCPTIYA